MTYDVSVIRDRSEFQRELPEWHAFLARKTTGCVVFNDPSVIQFAIEQENVTPFIVMVRRDGTLQCIAPFRLEESKLRLQFSVFTLASLPVHLMTLFGNAFCFAADADASECCSLAFDAIQSADFDVSFLYGIETKSALWNYCTSETHKPVGLRFTRPSRMVDQGFRLEMPATFADYLTMLGPNTRASLKRRTKKLLNDHGATLIKVTAPDQVAAFLNAANEVYRDSWQAKTHGPLDRNSNAEIARVEHLARNGFLRCYLLTSNQGPLAFQFGYAYGDTYYACDFAFAQKSATLGTGAVLMYLMLEDFYRDGPPRILDLGNGDSPQKHSFRSTPHSVADYYVVPCNRWRHFITLQRGLSEIEFVTRAALAKAGLDKGVRQFLKYKRN